MKTTTPQKTTAKTTTTSDAAECQVASGLSLCAVWNGEAIGTCYNSADIDDRAQELVDAFGGGACAVEWACAAIATCYFSANERHWCVWTNKTVCEDAFNGCGITHAPSPDYPTSWTDTVETPEPLSGWVDSDTASDVQTRTLNGETLTLVFSDEFNEEGRDLGPGKDAKWEAVDLHYSATNDDEIYKPSGVTVSGGYASIKFEVNTTYDLGNTEKAFKSAMLQGWNKFCFTGGYLEARMNQPGKATTSGIWSAFWTLANLGRAGYLDSTDGMWPFTYDHCDAVASEGQAAWENTNQGPQNFSACKDFNAEYGFQSYVGRGVAEVDVFELVVPPKWYNAKRPAHLSTSLQLSPKIPPNTTHGGGLTGDCSNTSDTCTGIHFYPHNGHNTGMNTWCMQPGYPSAETTDVLGNQLQDCISAESDVYDTHFEEQHTYGMWIEPGEWVAWYLDGVLLFNATKDALTNKTNPYNSSEAVGSRQVPVEPMYIILNVASSENNFLPRDPDLELPVYMHVDWVRLYQNTGRHSVGCDPPDYPTATYINKNLDKFKTSRCGNGQCESGECEQCPRDCQYQAACRQDCRVPRCQVLDGRFTTPTAFWVFQLNSDDSSKTPIADVDWQSGTDAMLINITESGTSAYLIAVSQSRQLLCQNFRYRVAVTARSLNGTGGFTAVVTGGAASAYASLLPDALNATFTSTDPVTITQDFEVSSRWESGQVAIQLGGQGNDNTVIELQEVSLCPIPSRAQMCELAPRQAASTAAAAMTQGNSRVTADDTVSGQRAFGVLEVVHDSAPTHSSYLASNTAYSQSSEDGGVTARAYFWASTTTTTATTSSRRNFIQRRANAQRQTAGTGTGRGGQARRISGSGTRNAMETTQEHTSTPASPTGTRTTAMRDATTNTEYYSVDFLVVHAAAWFESGSMVQVIALHRTANGSHLPTRSTLVAPLYCNTDAVGATPDGDAMVLNCSEWTTADLPLDSSPTTVDNFTSTRTVTPGSVAYQAINPLRGTILLDTAEYAELDGEELYAIMYMEDDGTAYGRVRGVVERHVQASCIGGLVFEYSDEWWKGGDDTYHLNCYDDNASFQSPCGYSSTGFGPDGRLNEEFFGLYGMSIEGEAPYRITMTARPAVAALRALWGVVDPNTTTAPSPRRAPRRTIDGTFSAVFPNPILSLLEEREGLFLLGLLTLFIVLGTALPIVWSVWRSPRTEKPVAEHVRASDDAPQRLPGDILERSQSIPESQKIPEHEPEELAPTVSLALMHRNLHGLRPIELVGGPAENDVASAVPSQYTGLLQYVRGLAQLFWRALSTDTDRDYLVRDVVLPEIQRLGDGKAVVRLDALTEALQWPGRYEPWHGALLLLLAEYPQAVEVDAELARVRVRDAAAVTPEEWVEADGSVFVVRAYMRHVRQQLSRTARHGDRVLDWAAEADFESAFNAFDAEAVGQACTHLFRLVCPADVALAEWAPADLHTGDGPKYYDYAALTVLFLAVQQFCENLRQSGHFKKRTWQYLAAALPQFHPRDLDSSDPRWAPFRQRCGGVRKLLRLLLTMVDKDVINFADVDDIFSRTTVDGLTPEDAHKVPMYRAPEPQGFQWCIPMRRLPPVRKYEDLIPGPVGSPAALIETFCKTFSDTVTKMTLLRLFFFVFHAHALLFLACLILLTRNVPWDGALWLLSVFEVFMVLLKAFTTASLLQPHWPMPPLLDIVELLLAIGFGGAMAADFFASSEDLVKRPGYTFDISLLNLVFLATTGAITAVREAVRLLWKYRSGFWTDVHKGRMMAFSSSSSWTSS